MDTDDTTNKMESTKISVSKIKHDWYQTETHVIVMILVKNSENVKIEYEKNMLSVSAKLPSGSDYSLELDLAHLIIPGQCSHKVLSSKIEIKLKKQNGIRWNTLEGNLVEQNVVQPIPTEILQANDQTPKYPSSCKKFRDWDKVEKEIEKQEAQEEPEGEAAVNALLQRIYGNGSDEVRRAMNKSFVESGGTVLSTNWSEVGQGKVEKKPPDGMEWKTWNS
ncbi:PREDICTED: protein SGT1 homolog [Dinoponera quadriceps]|uniref:Protein SGT1 homolog n=1 Tax=Dinoponera quadriceps TaxID=609295 RepID=A0A6P3YA90_DINQU|nr:PREDICTED: protein SGT1 homolog [Dinoponera quadriceps]XP_014487883.1 PREDICTED: protein SGT1 homolog [Dinoponera quadriceps]XP_014487891.1 PREDICTED: protein SGT1 homolog [Dinoponera quadriceps]